ncbi:MAG: hypothetical protein CMI90_05220, partial [Pelagibacteraceae bacterium]|nr:hypothetical protein [Pelagibacteraceae bacterium]
GKKLDKKLDDYLNNILKKNELVDIQRELVDYLVYKQQIKKILLSKKLLDLLISILGPDIHYIRSFDMAINRNEEKGYFFKNPHQEFWSGCGLSTVQLWIPIFYEHGMGTIDFYPGSHKMGLIPNKNRKPYKLPKNIKSKNLKINLGDVFVFHSLTLHKSSLNLSKKTRIAFPIQVTNISIDNQTGYDNLKDFGELHRGPLNKIKKLLGNPLLSPFRTEKSEITKY